MQEIKDIKKKIAPILLENDVQFAGIFGSYGRGNENENSDIDILVKFKSSKSLLDIIGLEITLSDFLGLRVDLVTEQALCPHIKKEVLKDFRLIYGER